MSYHIVKLIATEDPAPRQHQISNSEHVSSTMYGYATNKVLAMVNFNMSNVRKWTVVDSGATENCLVSDAPLAERVPDDNPISVTLPDGNKIQSTHAGMLDIPQLP